MDSGSACRDLMREGAAAGLWLGAEVAAGDKDGVLIHDASGMSRLHPAVEWKPGSIVDMASVTKAVATSSAVAKCIETGLMDLDRPLGSLLPEVSPEAGAIPLRSLATHSSGFDNSKGYFKQMEGNYWSIVEGALKERPVRKPGEGYLYACINLILLGLAVEAVSKLRLDVFCEQEIFAPLGMSDTCFGPLDRRDPRLVKMKDVDAGFISDEPARFAGRPIGNAGLFSTAPDLSRYCRMILNGGELDGRRVLASGSPALFERNLNPEGLRPRSLGWDKGPDLLPRGMSERAFYHNGWTGQSVFIDPGTGLFATVLTNRMGPNEESKAARTEIASALIARMAEGRAPSA